MTTTTETTTTDAPKGDAKQQEREARKAALAAKKAELAAKAEAAKAKVNAEHGHTTPPPAPPTAAPKGEPVDAPESPSAPEATPPVLTPRERLQALVDARPALTAKALRDAITAIVADMAKPKPARTPASGGNGKTSAAAAELESRMLTIMGDQEISLQDVMRAMECDMKDAKPYNAMKRMVADGRVVIVKATAPKTYRKASK